MNLATIAKKFQISGVLRKIIPITNGNINKTYVVTFEESDESEHKYIMQKINSKVFTEPYKVMENIFLITSCIGKDKDPEKVLRVIPTKSGKMMYVFTDDSGEKVYYRMYNFIKNAVTHDTVSDLSIVENAGKAFGEFTALFDKCAISLYETIPDFHNTLKRYENLKQALKADVVGRSSDVSEEFLYLFLHEDLYSIILDNLKYGVPLRVTHNDTKINNVMMDKDTGEYITVIDLDTVMSGSLLYDYGDGIRSAASTSKEDEADLSKVEFDFEIFKAYTRGYMSKCSHIMTSKELELMATSALILTLELAMRFLTDYLNGDTYFNTDPNILNHNLIRARNQIKLAKEIEKRIPAMNDFIKSINN